MKCYTCPTTLIGKFCHNCGAENPSFSKLEPLCFEELAEIFSTYPTPAICVERCGVCRIDAIKMYRQVSGLGLREAKDAIDVAYFNKYPPTHPW